MLSLEERLASLEEAFLSSGGGGKKLPYLRNFWENRNK